MEKLSSKKFESFKENEVSALNKIMGGEKVATFKNPATGQACCDTSYIDKNCGDTYYWDPCPPNS